MCIGFLDDGTPLKNTKGVCGQYWDGSISSNNIINAGILGL